MKLSLSKILQFLVFAGAGLAIMILVYRDQSAKYLEQELAKGNSPEDSILYEKVIEDFASANFFWLLSVLLIFMISNIFRTIRWQMMFRPLGYETRTANVFMATMIGYFANLGLPRSGEIIKAGIVHKYEGVPVEKIIGTVVTDRAIDVLCLLTVIGLALMIEYDTIWRFLSQNDSISNKISLITDHPWTIAGGILVIGIVLVLIWTRSGLRQSKLGQKLSQTIRGIWEGILSVTKLSNPLLFIGLTVGIWVCYFLMTYLCFFSFEPTSHLNLGAGLITFVLGTLGIVFPSPGGLGSYHVMIMEALNLYHIDSTTAFSFANIIFFSIQIFCNVFFGLLSLLLLPILNRE